MDHANRCSGARGVIPTRYQKSRRLPGWKAAPSQAVQAPLVLELAQRTRRGVGCWAGKPAQPFFFLLPLALDTHDREKGLREQREGDVSIPAMPGPHLIVSQSHLTLAYLKTLLHRPATADGLHHLFHRGSRLGKDQEIGQLVLPCSVLQAAAHDQPALPAH